MRRFRSPKWWPLGALLAYLALAAAGNILIFGGVVLAKAMGRGPSVEGENLPRIENFRQVDDRMYAGGQPDDEAFRRLADLDVDLVVDFRAHSRGDPGRDDPELLHSLGMEYVRLPVPDGQAPNYQTIDRFVEVIEGHRGGKIFIHCGGGVGRSTVMSAAYLAATGRNPSVLDQLGVGPPSLEQIWFVAAVGEDDPTARSRPVELFSRYVIDGPRVLFHKLTG
jgi:protein tyrosine phosphatase (PTP) superfamily phosphohydrolase (DUF442 family)